MRLLKAKRLFSLLALFSVAFNNFSTPLYVYAQETNEPTPEVGQVLESPAPSETPVISDTPTPAPDDTIVPGLDAVPADTFLPDPAPATSEGEPAPDLSQPVEPVVNENALPEAPPTVTVEGTESSPEPIAPEGDEKLQVTIIEQVTPEAIEVMQYNPDGTASIVTDKADYAPTDLVVITGVGFDANREYDLLITGTDNFSFKTKVTTNEKGELLYSYQLDGTPRPDYKVEIKDAGLVIASIDFTDSDKIKICHATDSHTNQYVEKNPDKSADLAGHNGHDGPVWYSGITTKWGDIIPPFEYNCYWWFGWHCSQYPGKNWDVQGKAIYNNGCNIPVTTGTIVIQKDSVPDNSQPFHFTYAPNSYPIGDFTLSDGGTDPNSIKFENIPAGTYSWSEDLVIGWKLSGISCNDTNSTGSLATRSVSVVLAAGETVTCKYTNEQLTGSIQVGKEIDTDGDNEYDDIDTIGFKWGYKGEIPARVMGTSVLNVPYGMYEITESDSPFYKFVGWYSKKNKDRYSCKNPEGIIYPISVTVGENSDQSAIIICNKISVGSLVIQKDAQPDSGQDFKFVVKDSDGKQIADPVLDDDSGWGASSTKNTVTIENIPAGEYSIDENVVGDSNDWVLSSALCSSDSKTWSLNKETLIVNIGAGSTVTCKFINQKKGDIEGYKFEDKDADNSKDHWENKLNGWRIELRDENGVYIDHRITSSHFIRYGEYEFEDIKPGNYQLCEVPNISQSEWTPTTGELCKKITLSPGETENVNFANHKPMQIKAYKVVCPLEGDLPDWGDGGWFNTPSEIQSWTADSFIINSHKGCYYESGWQFQWGYEDAESAPGNTMGPISGWENFDTTTIGSGGHGSQIPASVTIGDLKGSDRIWVREVLPAGNEWLPFSDAMIGDRHMNKISAELYCGSDIRNFDNYDKIENPLYGETYYCIGLNTFNRGNIGGYKWVDDDGDGFWDNEIENSKSGWTIELYKGQDVNTRPYNPDMPTGLTLISSTTTNSNGYYEFRDLLPGTYQVCEQNSKGYIQTYPNGCHTVILSSGQNSTSNNFGNMPVILAITIEKSNVLNASNGTVDYTIKVKNTGNQDFNSFEIHDALPGGFTYIPGTSTLEGGSIVDPTFNSGEAKWAILDGGIAVGQTLTLKYRVSIDSSLPAGVYTNFAYAVGKYIYPWAQKDEPSITPGDQVEARIVNSEVIVLSEVAFTDVVDSAVELTSSVSYGGKLVGQVLGASTEVLPATGSETWVIMLATALVVVGFATKGAALIIEERKRKNA